MLSLSPVTSAALVWLGIGFASFWLARAAWQLESGRKPITIGAVVSSIASSVFGPFVLIMAATWFVSWLVEGNNSVARFLRTPIVDLCTRRDQ